MKTITSNCKIGEKSIIKETLREYNKYTIDQLMKVRPEVKTTVKEEKGA